MGQGLSPSRVLVWSGEMLRPHMRSPFDEVEMHLCQNRCILCVDQWATVFVTDQVGEECPKFGSASWLAICCAPYDVHDSGIAAAVYMPIHFPAFVLLSHPRACFLPRPRDMAASRYVLCVDGSPHSPMLTSQASQWSLPSPGLSIVPAANFGLSKRRGKLPRILTDGRLCNLSLSRMSLGRGAARPGRVWRLH